jgi:hypothetical protein
MPVSELMRLMLLLQETMLFQILVLIEISNGLLAVSVKLKVLLNTNGIQLMPVDSGKECQQLLLTQVTSITTRLEKIPKPLN